MAIALRLKAGDVTALKEAVIKTRPKPNYLTWSFWVEDYGIVKPAMISEEGATVQLFAHAAFLLEKGRFEDAISLYRKIAAIDSKFTAESLLGEALVYQKWALISIASPLSETSERNALERFAKSISLLRESIRLDPKLAQSHYELGSTLRAFGKKDEAVIELKRSLEIDKNFHAAHAILGFAFFEKAQFQDAITHLNKYLEFDRTSKHAKEVEAMLNRIQQEQNASYRSAKQDLKSYSNQEWNFSLKYPSAWDVFTKEDMLGKTRGLWSGAPNTVIAFANSKNLDENLFIQATPAPEGTPSEGNLKDLIKALDTEFPKHYPGFKKVSAFVTRIAGGVGIEYVMENKRLDTILRQREIIIIKNKRSFILTFTASKDSYDNVNRLYFQSVLDTLEL